MLREHRYLSTLINDQGIQFNRAEPPEALSASKPSRKLQCRSRNNFKRSPLLVPRSCHYAIKQNSPYSHCEGPYTLAQNSQSPRPSSSPTGTTVSVKPGNTKALESSLGFRLSEPSSTVLDMRTSEVVVRRCYFFAALAQEDLEGLRGLWGLGLGLGSAYLWLVGNRGMGYNYNYYYYHSSIPY